MKKKHFIHQCVTDWATEQHQKSMPSIKKNCLSVLNISIFGTSVVCSTATLWWRLVYCFTKIAHRPQCRRRVLCSSFAVSLCLVSLSWNTGDAATQLRFSAVRNTHGTHKKQSSSNISGDTSKYSRTYVLQFLVKWDKPWSTRPLCLIRAGRPDEHLTRRSGTTSSFVRCCEVQHHVWEMVIDPTAQIQGAEQKQSDGAVS